MHEGDHLARQCGGDAGRLQPQDFGLAFGVGIIDPIIEAAPLQRIVDLAGAVGGDDDDGRRRSLDRPELGNGDLVIRQHLEQIGLEGLVGAVELVNQQHWRAGEVGLERLQQWPLDQEFVGEDFLLDGILARAAGLG